MILVFFLSLALPATAAEYVYTAQTQTSAQQQGSVRAGGLTWVCQASQCTIKGPWEAPGVSACQALANIVGPINAYGRKGRMLGAADLAKCNQGLALAPTIKSVPQGLPRGAPYPAVPAEKAEAGIAVPKGDIRTTGLVTPAITFRGTGARLLPERSAELALVVTTSAITFQGTGAFPSRTAIDPVTVTTPQITFQGTGEIE